MSVTVSGDLVDDQFQDPEKCNIWTEYIEQLFISEIQSSYLKEMEIWKPVTAHTSKKKHKKNLKHSWNQEKNRDEKNHAINL